ncbi:stimulus-sensing domain-containing protein [Pikeienuella sp. HZG-20]|uniref:stimulus-sensing domain-containing protein n=1 Tax=Paludibacillus litoralis TaxID=3133267 RepID=UPI0030EE35C2
MRRSAKRRPTKRRARRPFAGVGAALFSLRARLGLVSKDQRRSRDAARLRLRRTRSRARRGGISPTNSLSRRIVAFNLIGLGLLVVGVLYLNQFRSGLIDQRTQSLETQGRIIAVAIAEAAGVGPSGTRFDPVRANVVLKRLVEPTGVRAQIYDRAGRLSGDTHNLLRGAGQIETHALPPPGQTAWEDPLSIVERVYRRVVRFFGGSPPLYKETALEGLAQEEEVFTALRGGVARWERVNSEDELIVSVTVPIQRFKAVLGVLVLSTEGGDIDDIVRAERMAILQVFVVALLISLALSVLLANTIAKPIRRLAAAAEAGGAQDARPINPQRIRFPDLTARTDEIGYLSSALRRMTEALYDRIDAIESFAADVAHEFKNPLTSLRSAVETLRIAKTPEMQSRLLDVIQSDVRRLDRLVTDISNASRLDAELTREEMESFDLADLIREVAGMNEADAAARSARIEVEEMAEALPVKGLEGRIGQVLQNLIGNSLSFAPPGGVVRISAERRAASVRVTVEDDGPGVPDASLRTIFERFYSERPDHEAFGDHSGLGLSISRQIIEAHGGTIWAENIRPYGAPKAPPAGARFVFELPL